MIGVNLHLPTKLPEWQGYDAYPDKRAKATADWKASTALISSLPKGTAIRTDLLWHELFWVPGVLDTQFVGDTLKAKIDLLASVDGPLIVGFIPIPWPGSGWRTGPTWGAVDPADFGLIAGRYAYAVGAVRSLWSLAGRVESELSFQIGNEPAAGHPGGNMGLPTGEWYDRHSLLYAQCAAAVGDWGTCRFILPAISMQDHKSDEAARELSSAKTFLRRLVRSKRGGGEVAAYHSRLFGPTLSTGDYAEAWIKRLRSFRDVAAATSGRKAICTETYLFREDRGAVDDRQEILRIVLPQITDLEAYFYRVGAGPTDPTTAVPVEWVSTIAPG